MATRYVAHRGGASQWPENSLTAFRNAIALGAGILEMDVHLTADGTVAVIHDATARQSAFSALSQCGMNDTRWRFGGRAISQERSRIAASPTASDRSTPSWDAV